MPQNSAVTEESFDVNEMWGNMIDDRAPNTPFPTEVARHRPEVLWGSFQNDSRQP